MYGTQTQPPHITVDAQFGVGVPARQEVIFADGTALWLHRVGDALPDLFMRRIEMPNGEFARVDLRQLAPDLAVDLPIAATRDVPGLVHWSLRLQFGGAHALREAVTQLQDVHA